MKVCKIILLLAFVIFSPLSFARIYVNMGEAQFKKSLIAVSPLIYEGKDNSLKQKYLNYGDNIYSVIVKNLTSSGYFDFIPQQSFVENPALVSVNPHPRDPRGFRWGNWRIIGAEFLMLSRYVVENNRIKLRVYMYDTLLRRSLFKKLYVSKVEKRFSLAHFVCNDIIEYLTKRPGIFLTKIATVRNTKGSKKEIFIMDWDGSNAKQVSFHKSISLSPAWNPRGLKLAYSAFIYRRSLKGRRANIFIYDLLKKRRKIISSFYGTNLGSAFFPSGDQMLISLSSKFGGLNIFKLDLRANKNYPILLGPKGSINVEPSIHPDGKKIVFSSDRMKSISLFEMGTYGEKIKKLTTIGSYNSSPDWSPDGKYIVFSGYSGGRFDIFIYDVENSKVSKRLTSSKNKRGKWADNEYPSFSPDGRRIVFSSNRTGRSQLYIINIDGTNLRRITWDKYNYKNPKWSPLIKQYIQL